MNVRRLGEPLIIEQEVPAGSPVKILLAKLENVVLLDFYLGSVSMPGAPQKNVFTFGPVLDGVAEKGAVRLDKLDLSTGKITEGEDIIVDIKPPLAMDASKEKTYRDITKDKMEKIIAALQGIGASISGNNPWNVDVHQHGIKLRGTWDEATSALKIVVTDKNFYVPYGKIWSTIDPLIRNI